MCGISGFNWKDAKKVEKMVDILSHRGPDANGVHVDEDISLGHNRLSIIDLSSSANQPMFDNDKTLTIVFNGEIYNFRELKEELKNDYIFKTKSDTEVILAGYKKWGKNVVHKLNGIFAFAIWDKENKELFCARDHAGIKPFYYFWDEKRFIFASELKAIFEHDIPRTLNKDAFNHYMRILYVPEPMTMVENIYKLPPKSTLSLKGNGLTIERYDDLTCTEDLSSYTKAKKAVKKNVLEAVERQLVSDVPVGLYLSGGIDSSTVLSAMSNFSKHIETFSIGFDLGEGEEREKFNKDFELAKRTAKHFGTNHNPHLISVGDMVTHFEESVAGCDDPISHPTAVAMMLLAKFAKEKVTVVLNGSGGDELFGGYERYKLALAAHYYKKLPKPLRILGNLHKKVAKLDFKGNIDLFAQFMFQKDPILKEVINEQVFKDDRFSKDYFEKRYVKKCTGDPASCLMDVDKESWLPDYFFLLSDRMSMKNALEERVPLTDRKLVAFSNALKRSYKLDLFQSKKVFRDAFMSDLPEFLFKQPKRGWFSPGAKWLRNKEFSTFVKNVLSPSYYGEMKPLFNWDSLESVLEKHINKEQYNLAVIWAALTFLVWAKQYEIKI